MATPGESIKFKESGVFQELLDEFDGNAEVIKAELPLDHLFPQILPGHRLWCYATKKVERFLPINRFEVLHSARTKQIWLNVYIGRSDLKRLGLPETTVLAEADLARDFEIVSTSFTENSVCFQQRTPEGYNFEPTEALAVIIRSVRNRIWETVKIVSPYRKPYVYCCPVAEHKARLPQVLSIYLLMFFFGSVTRYRPLYFEDLLGTELAPLVSTFISESPMQFLYLMASEILKREVSKPAIV